MIKRKNMHGSDVSDTDEDDGPAAEGASSSRAPLDLKNDPLAPFYKKAQASLNRAVNILFILR